MGTVFHHVALCLRFFFKYVKEKMTMVLLKIAKIKAFHFIMIRNVVIQFLMNSSCRTNFCTVLYINTKSLLSLRFRGRLVLK